MYTWAVLGYLSWEAFKGAKPGAKGGRSNCVFIIIICNICMFVCVQLRMYDCISSERVCML